ncbi:polymer-forming cytoskeletal protein [Candidatus Shapirobacteria bacterium]|nr:polymer-forming cytoskeletal protein [Candidatus Shapirobacteria bacterium]
MKIMTGIAVMLVIILFGLRGKIVTAQEDRLIMAPEIRLPKFEVGEDREITEPIDGDLISAGGQVKVLSEITGDAYIAGGQVEFDGVIDQDLIVAGGNVIIRGRIGKNLIVVGGQVKIEETAMVGGYVLAAGGEVIINGQVEGPVKAATSKLTIGEMAYIGGNLEADVEKVMIVDTAQIAGERRVNIHKVESPRMSETGNEAMRGIVAVGKIVYFLSKLVTLLVLVVIGGKLMAPAGALMTRFWTTLGLGMVVTIVTPFVMMILMMSVLGIPLSIITFGVYLLALYLSSLVVAMALGNVISKNGWLPIKNNYLLSIIGLIVISVITNIPLIGWLMSVVVCFLGMGIIFKLATERKVVATKK